MKLKVFSVIRFSRQLAARSASASFTLIELLLAVATGALVVLTAYAVFFQINLINSRQEIVLKELSPTLELFLKDVLNQNPYYGSFKFEEGNLTFFTENCYRFKGICEVSYFSCANTLFRRECPLKKNLSTYCPTIPIMRGVNIYVKDYDNKNPPRCFKVIFATEEGKVPLVVRQGWR